MAREVYRCLDGLLVVCVRGRPRMWSGGEALIEAGVQAGGVPGQQGGDTVDGVIGNTLEHVA
jgi:hypothetical protein